MRASTAAPAELKKTVWVWTENRQVMTAAVERGWSTFLFGSKDLGEDWSCENNYFLYLKPIILYNLQIPKTDAD
jgi:hypothetical protein